MTRFEDVGDADEVGDEARGWLLVELVRRAGLHDAAGVHHGEAGRHRHRLLLVVGHYDEGEAELVLQAHHLESRALAQLAVERRQRLVEQQNLGSLDQGAGERHALALTTGKLRGLAGAEAVEPDQRERFGDACRDLALRNALAA